MGGHHQEDHVVDDVGVGEPVAVVVFGLAQHRQQVVARRFAALFDSGGEVVFQQLACSQSSPPGERWHAGADHRVAGTGGNRERLVHLGDQFVIGAGFVAHEDHRGDVKRERLHGRIDKEACVVDDPVVGDHPRDDPVHLLEVAGEPGPDERLLHDPSVEHVLFEVEQHQAAVEEGPDHGHPALLRVVLVAVGVDDLRRVRAQCCDTRQHS
ncbi:Uncharacterised protein [Mycobacterium tuberculosis]|nr:Uncharacterised protein [Mycobacterium tuberculosis]CNV90568.1 Uncharacterised protein [Mycobacterium tuberculosis]SGH36325.1 Uncharacterised protein [Mycobacterium tuberculosis]SGJ18043.1 Uncharacterised protein [Mycobacterium tuberculosis]SGJ41709.1 Uncharacterised protein [Mycobacterium tuberculosis]